MSSQKIAIVLFADTPLLGQAGLQLQNTFSPHTSEKLYVHYIEELQKNSKEAKADLWFTCEETFQESLLLQHFPNVTGCKIASGDMSAKMKLLTDYFLTYQNYEYVVFLLRSFIFIDTNSINQLSQQFRLTRRGVVLLTDTHTNQLEALGISFPFTRVYEDVIWTKDQVQLELKAQCKTYGIPCKILSIEKLALGDLNKKTENDQIAPSYPEFNKSLQTAMEKKRDN